MEHLHSGINFITPYQRHYGLDKAVMAKRTKVYELAKAKQPERWSGDIRNWSLPDYVCLNHMNETEVRKFINTKGISLKQIEYRNIHLKKVVQESVDNPN